MSPSHFRPHQRTTPAKKIHWAMDAAMSHTALTYPQTMLQKAVPVHLAADSHDTKQFHSA